MKAVIVDKASGNLLVRETEMPEPGAGEVLIKVLAAPINPSDLAGIKRVRGNTDEEPFIPGLEGAGTVIKAGRGLLPRLWLGKRVTCSPKHGSGGTWAEYIVTSAGSCFPLSDKVSDEQGSMSLVNPLTALSFLEIVKKNDHKAIINNAAASALGRMVELLSTRHGIPLINIVRSQKQADDLRNKGSKYVLNSSDPLFTFNLASLSRELNATILFDSVCGENLHLLIESLPYGSTVVIYGSLSPDEYVSISPRNLLTNDIRIKGFYLGNTSREAGMIKNMMNLLRVRQLMKGNLKITVQNRFPLEKVQTAIDTYLSNMSAGKVLLIP